MSRATMKRDQNGNPIPTLRPVTGSTIVRTTSGSSAQSAAVGTEGQYRICATEDCYLEVGSDPTASTSTIPMGKFSPEVWPLSATDKIAAIQKDTAGAVHITRME